MLQRSWCKSPTRLNKIHSFFLKFNGMLVGPLDIVKTNCTAAQYLPLLVSFNTTEILPMESRLGLRLSTVSNLNMLQNSERTLYTSAVLHTAVPEDPQLRLENSSRTHVRHAFVGMRTFPEGVCGIHERMRFTLNPCDAPHRPSDPPMWSDLPKTPKSLDTLRRSELVKKMVLLLKFWLAELVM